MGRRSKESPQTSKNKRVARFSEVAKKNAQKENSFKVKHTGYGTIGYIGYTIREVREKRDLTLGYVSNKAGISISHLSNIETNKSKVCPFTIFKVCAALDMPSVGELFENAYRIFIGANLKQV